MPSGQIVHDGTGRGATAVSGPAQLALAILLAVTDEAWALDAGDVLSLA